MEDRDLSFISTIKYRNFVRPSSPHELVKPAKLELNGDEVKKIYLEEVSDVGNPAPAEVNNLRHLVHRKRRTNNSKPSKIEVTDKDLFVMVQDDNVGDVIKVLDGQPDKINVRDEFGWSLLMIACQASSIETVKELLKRNVDVDIRDKAGNSARSLVIKNKNVALANIILSHKPTTTKINSNEKRGGEKQRKGKLKGEFICKICNKTYEDKEDHLSSTLHNINASKGRKLPTNYIIPESNKGFQLMLKGGWDKESGLGPDGSGNKYPIKATQKKDRKGIGHKRKQLDEESRDTKIKLTTKLSRAREDHNNRTLEINFRREFY